MNRTRSLYLGLVLLFFGFQMRSVASFTLTPNATRFIESRLKGPNAGATPAPQYPYTSYNASAGGDQYIRGYRRVVVPPEWLTFVFFSAGAVLTAKALLVRT